MEIVIDDCPYCGTKLKSVLLPGHDIIFRTPAGEKKLHKPGMVYIVCEVCKITWMQRFARKKRIEIKDTENIEVR